MSGDYLNEYNDPGPVKAGDPSSASRDWCNKSKLAKGGVVNHQIGDVTRTQKWCGHFMGDECGCGPSIQKDCGCFKYSNCDCNGMIEVKE